MKILVLHGPNTNLIGKYSNNNLTLGKINKALRVQAKNLNQELAIFHFLEEGKFIRQIQRRRKSIDGILFNPGALAKSCYIIREIIEIIDKPLIEIHIEDLPGSKNNYKKSVLKPTATNRFYGSPIPTYVKGLKEMNKFYSTNSNQ
ncbi:MAG: type II 3-dehydroquinate dehydratase [Candidatus Marinimicrobia bacterium]|nr:type II 3-dehydroquinate dehydratase [Candidatus Neomarinimicrobiota bacterium]